MTETTMPNETAPTEATPTESAPIESAPIESAPIESAPIESAYVICELNDIPSKRAYGFYLARIDEDGNERPWPIVIIRWGRQAFGYVNRCPHNGVNLDWERDQFLDAYGTRLMCGKHGALFDIGTGECVDGPCTGQGLEPIDVQVIDGDICVLGVELAGFEDEGEEVELDGAIA